MINFLYRIDFIFYIGGIESSLTEVTTEKKLSQTLRKVEGKRDDANHEKLIMTLRKSKPEQHQHKSTGLKKLFLASQQQLDRKQENLLGNSRF